MPLRTAHAKVGAIVGHPSNEKECGAGVHQVRPQGVWFTPEVGVRVGQGIDWEMNSRRRGVDSVDGPKTTSLAPSPADVATHHRRRRRRRRRGRSATSPSIRRRPLQWTVGRSSDRRAPWEPKPATPDTVPFSSFLLSRRWKWDGQIKAATLGTSRDEK